MWISTTRRIGTMRMWCENIQKHGSRRRPLVRIHPTRMARDQMDPMTIGTMGGGKYDSAETGSSEV
jgi:hypothetical protein